MSIQAAFIVPHPPLIIPTIGHGEEKGIQHTIDAYTAVAQRIAQIKPETIVVSSPHSTLYSDYFHISPGAGAKGDMGRFYAYTTTMEVGYDIGLVSAIEAAATRAHIPAGTLGEHEPKLDHATFIPLYFVNQFYTDYQVVRIGLSGLSPLDHYEFGRCIQDAVERTGRKVVYIASGDLSHVLKEDGPYGFEPEGPVFDEQVTEAMATGDFARFLTFEQGFCDNAAECGLRSFQIMAGVLDRLDVSHELLSYEGPFGVGYAVASFEVLGPDPSRDFGEQYRVREMARVSSIKEGEDPYVQLARLSVESYVRGRMRVPRPEGLPQDMTDRCAGVFVSLHRHNQLRGCIGTIRAVRECVADEIIANAISACSHDPRFNAVEPEELDELVYSVDVLGPTEPIDSAADLDVKRYGVVVTSGARRGLLLPNLEGVNTVEQQVQIACRKAGIEPDEEYALERFEVVRHS